MQGSEVKGTVECDTVWCCCGCHSHIPTGNSLCFVGASHLVNKALTLLSMTLKLLPNKLLPDDYTMFQSTNHFPLLSSSSLSPSSELPSRPTKSRQAKISHLIPLLPLLRNVNLLRQFVLCFKPKFRSLTSLGETMSGWQSGLSLW